jgi:endonuclease YncB( thermonuclease family)
VLQKLGRTRAQRSALLVAGGVLAFLFGRWTEDSSARGTSARDRKIPETASGPALVLDGDTLDIGGLRVRLHGIDAPERDQLCERADGSRYGCGQFARELLVALVDHRPVRCEKRDVDQYGRMVGVCSGAEPDFGAALVEHGAAIAYRHYSMDYVAQEQKAQHASRGIWQGRFEAPWDYRRGQQKSRESK